MNCHTKERRPELGDSQHGRSSIRLERFDYSSKGAYFITICVKEHKCVFGRIAEGKMELNRFGEIAKEMWMDIQVNDQMIFLDEFVIMPNHMHGIIVIKKNPDEAVGAIHESPCKKVTIQSKRAIHELPLRVQRRKMVMPMAIGRFKMRSAKQINIMRGTPGAEFWQRNYYEHIVRNEAELNKTRQYIELNPAQWQFDMENEHRVENEGYAKLWEDVL